MRLFNKYYYGDFGEEKNETAAEKSNGFASPPLGPPVPVQTGVGGLGASWPLWEIFIRSKQGLDHKHAGSLHAADAQMAMENARDVYCRRMEGVSIWVVESKYIHASNPDEAESLYDPANDKVYRYPTFYNIPEEVKNM